MRFFILERVIYMNYEFKLATKEDFDFVFFVKKQNYKKYVEELWSWDEEEQAKINRETYLERVHNYRIITLNNNNIGTFCSHITADNEYFLNEINLIKEYQRLGIGTNILNDIIEMNKKDKRNIILQVFKTNPAKKLYERLGFKTYNETESHYKMLKKVED